MSQMPPMYRMPVGFGPATGPRRGPDGRRFLHDRRSNFGVVFRFRSDREILRRMTPSEFELADDPVVTINSNHMTNIDWLAGRSYAVLGVRWRVHYRGSRDQVDGEYLAVLWENMTDPILTGRDELGIAKLYADLPTPVIEDGRMTVRAIWDGFTFLELGLEVGSDLPLPIPPERLASFGEGLLNVKYLPATGDWGGTDHQSVTLTPFDTPEGFDGETMDAAYAASASMRFYEARWEDLPTQYAMVNALSEMPVIEPVTCFVYRSTGFHDHSNQRVLR